MLSRAEREAQALKDDISVEHLLLALAEEGAGPEALCSSAWGLERDKLLLAMQAVRGSQRITSDNPEGTFEALRRYGGT